MPRTRGEFPLTEQSSGGGPGGLNGSVNPETRLPSRAQGTPVAVVISQPAISDKGRGSHAGVWAGRIAADGVGPRAGGGQTRGEEAAGGSPPAPASGGFADGEKFVSKSGRGRAAPARPRVSAPGTLAGRLPRQSVAFGRGTRAHASATRHGRTGRWPERGVRVSQEGLPRGVPRPLTCGKTGDTFGFVTQCHGLGSRTKDTRCPTDPGLDAGGHAVRSVAVPPRP